MNGEEDTFEAERQDAVDRFWQRKRAEAQERAADEGRDIRHTDPVSTTRSLPKTTPAPSRTTASDLAIVKAISEANGELIGRVRREIDGELKSLREELEALRQEVAALKGPQLRSVA